MKKILNAVSFTAAFVDANEAERFADYIRKEIQDADDPVCLDIEVKVVAEKTVRISGGIVAANQLYDSIKKDAFDSLF